MGPPAGNVELVAWPSVCTDQDAGAINSTATPTVATIRRTRWLETSTRPSAAAAVAPTISQRAHSRSAALVPITIASVTAPPSRISGPAWRVSSE